MLVPDFWLVWCRRVVCCRLSFDDPWLSPGRMSRSAACFAAADLHGIRMNQALTTDQRFEQCATAVQGLLQAVQELQRAAVLLQT
ncbi:MAG: hypothetical protein ACKPJD_20495, partial [Planctomycetaceae bacterium]